MEETAERTWAAVERAKAEEALRQSEEKYRTIFETIDEGFCIQELLTDEAGNVTDIIYREVNQAYAKHSGITDAIGKKARELFPNLDQHWLDSMTHVYKTGEPIRSEGYHSDLNRWFTLQYSRVGGPGSRLISAVFNDITERKQREQQQAFLLRFSDTLRVEPNVDAVANSALQMLFAHLKLDRCYVGVYKLTEDRGEFPYQVGNERVPPVPDTVRLSDFPDALRVALERTLVIDDVASAEGMSDTDRQNLGGLGMCGLVAASLRSGEGKPIWSIVAISASARTWTLNEIKLIEEVTERTWAALERVKTESSLRESEERLRTAQEAGKIGIWDFSAATSEVQWSATMWKMYGYMHPPEKVEKYLWENSIHSEDRERMVKGVADFMASAQNEFRDEFRILTVNGEVRWIETVGRVVRDKSGRPITMAGVNIDITDRKSAEKALSRSESRLRTLADAVPQVIWTNNLEGKANYFNKRWYEYSGLTYEQSEGLGWQAIVHPEDAPASIEKWKEALAAGEVFDTEYRLRHQDGGYYWFIGRNVPLKDETGKVTGWFGSATDIENLKKTQEALSQSEERLRITMESATDYAIIVLDNERRVERWSQGATQIFGYSEAEMREQLADIIYTREDRKTGVPQKEMEMARHAGRAADERWHQRKDGSRFFVSGVLRPIKNSKLTGYVKVMRDMTQQQLFTEELTRLVNERTAELKRSNEDLRQFAHVASHDLKEPVRKIKTFNNRLKEEFFDSLPKKAQVYVEKIDSSTDRMCAMIEGVLKYSKVNSEVEKFETVDLNDVIKQIQTDLEVLIEDKKAQILVAKLPAITGSSILIYQLFYNLILNSLKFVRAGVSSLVSISSTVVEEKENKFYKITVSDNGIGFDAEFKDVIFNTFTRLNSADEYEGTGLGLSLCKKIVERHKGLISARGSENEGATFIIMLPVN